MKYKLTETTITWGEFTLYQIQCTADFADVKKGDLGGWIENKSNLSQKDDSWVYDNSKVMNNSVVYDNSKVMNNSVVYDNSRVMNNSVVDNSVVDNSVVDNSVVMNRSEYTDIEALAKGVSWYDYEIGKALKLPPVGEHVELAFFIDKQDTILEEWQSGFLKGKYETMIWVRSEKYKNETHAISSVLFRPFDWNKARDEWINKAIKCKKNNFIKTPGIGIIIGDIYDAWKSGELPQP